MILRRRIPMTEEEDAIGTLSKISYIHDVGVLDGSSGTSLAFETRDRLAFPQVLVAGMSGRTVFTRDTPGHQILILREIDLAHRAATQTLLQEIAA